MTQLCATHCTSSGLQTQQHTCLSWEEMGPGTGKRGEGSAHISFDIVLQGSSVGIVTAAAGLLVGKVIFHSSGWKYLAVQAGKGRKRFHVPEGDLLSGGDTSPPHTPNTGPTETLTALVIG